MIADHTPTKRTGRRVLIVLSVLAASIVLVGVLLPYLIPRSLLRERLAGALSDAFGRQVQVGDISVGWLDGVRVRDVVADEPASVSDESSPLRSLQIGQVSCSFSPVTLLRYRRVEHLRIDDFLVRLCLPGASGESTGPSAVGTLDTLPVGQITLSNGTIVLDHTRLQHSIAVRIDKGSMTLANDASAAGVDVRGSLYPPNVQETTSGRHQAGNFSVTADLTRSSPSSALAGTIQLDWEQIDCDVLDVGALTALNIRLPGRFFSGSASVDIDQDLHVTWDISTALSEESDIPQGHGKIAVGDRVFRFTTAGRHDPITGNLHLDSLACAAPGIELAGSGRCVLTGSQVRTADVRTSGTLELSRLYSMVPDLDTMLGSPAIMSGPCRYDATWQRTATGDTIACRVQADQARIIVGDIVSKLPGTPANMEATVSLHRDTRSLRGSIDSLAINLGESCLSGQVHCVRPVAANVGAAGFGDCMLDGVLNLDVSAMEQVASLSPLLARYLQDMDVSGSLRSSLAVQFDGHGGTVHLAAAVPQESHVDMQPLLTNRTDNGVYQPMSLQVALHIDRNWSSAHRIGAQARVGDASLHIAAQDTTLTISTDAVDDTDTLRGQLAMAVDGELEGIDTWLTAVPALSAALQDTPRMPGIRAAGSARMRVWLNAMVLDDGQKLWAGPARCRVELDASDTSLQIPGIANKRHGRPCAVAVDYWYDPERGDDVFRAVAGRLSTSPIEVHARVQTSAHSQLAHHYELRVASMHDLRALAPAIADNLGAAMPYSGRLDCEVDYYRRDDTQRVQWQIAGHDMLFADALAVPGEVDTMTDSQPVHFTSSGKLTGHTSADQRTSTFAVDQLTFALGDSKVAVEQGHLVLDNHQAADWLHQMSTSGHALWLRQFILEADWQARATLSLSDAATSSLGTLGQVLVEHQCAGPVELVCDGSLSDRVLTLGADIHADQAVAVIPLEGKLAELVTGVEHPRYYKRAGDALSLHVGATLRPPAIESGNLTFSADIATTSDTLPAINGTWDGQLRTASTWPWLYLEGFTARSQLGPIRLGQLHRQCALADDVALAGSVRASTAAAWFGGRWHSVESQLHCDDVRVGWHDLTFGIDGRIRQHNSRIETDSLRIEHGPTWAVLAMDIQDTLAAPFGEVYLTCNRVDLPALGETVDTVLDELTKVGLHQEPAATQSTTPAFDIDAPDHEDVPPPVLPDPAYEAELLAAFQPTRTWLKRADIDLHARIHEFFLPDARTGKTYHLDEVNITADISRQLGRINFFAAMASGLVNGSWQIVLSQYNPQTVLNYRLDAVNAVESTQPLIERFFPGMSVDGTITLEETVRQRLFAARPDWPNFGESKGVMILTDGSMIGRAAPGWVTALFPRLNFARYNYRMMRNDFERGPDGVTHNDMRFRGKYYHVYIDGQSYPNYYIDYQVGIDLLAGAAGEQLEKPTEGRIPLFQSTGWNVDGEFVDQRITYEPIDLIWTVLIENNLITQAYRALNRRLADPESARDEPDIQQFPQ